MEQHAISSDLIRGHIDTIILHTLVDGDKYAQQISDCIEEKSQKEYKINQATLYSSLKRLESLRYVKSYWNDSENGRRKYFNLTEIGKQTVENNLSSWSYSRSIIDKLMDCEQQPIYKTQIIEKIVEKPVEIIKEVQVNVPVQASPIILQPIIEQNTAQIEVKNVEMEEKTEVKQENTAQPLNDNSQDINFRNILSGLIKSSYKQKNTENNEELKPIEKTDSDVPSQNEIQKFNETITNINYNAERSNNGKIDFGDLMLDAAKDGYKLRVSSKDSFVIKGTIYQNKLNFATSIIMLLVSLIPLLLVSLVFGKGSPIKNYVAIIGASLFAIAPIYYTIKYLLDPTFTALKRTNKDEILTSAIIAFNVLILTLAGNFIFDVDFTNITIISFTLILPLVLSFVFVVCFLLKSKLSTINSFKVGGKK